MNLTLARMQYNNNSITHGLLLNGVAFICYTLELPWNNNKTNESCIPCGDYRVEWEYSVKFKRSLYELRDVAGRSEIKFHAGNWLSQTDGCILPGLTQAGAAIERSADALDVIYSIVESPKPFTLNIRNMALYIPGEQEKGNGAGKDDTNK